MVMWKSDDMNDMKMAIAIYSNNIKKGYYTSFEEVIK